MGYVKVWSKLAMLTPHQLLRSAMVDAVEARPGTGRDRASFDVALETVRD